MNTAEDVVESQLMPACADELERLQSEIESLDAKWKADARKVAQLDARARFLADYKEADGPTRENTQKAYESEMGHLRGDEAILERKKAELKAFEKFIEKLSAQHGVRA